MLENFLTVGQQVVILFILIGIGFVLDKTKLVGEKCISGITNIVLYFVTPCVIIQSFQREFNADMLVGLGQTGLIAIFSHILCILTAKIFIREKAVAKNKVYRFAIVFSNCGYMSLPLMQAVLGSEGVFYGAAYIAVFNLVLWTYGLLLMSGDKSQISVKKVVTNPGIMGVFVGLFFFLCSITLPELIAQPVSYMASLNTPLPMIVIGFYLARADLKEVWKEKYVYVTLFLRLIFTPLIALACMYFAGIRGVVFVACTISASAPAAAATTMFASKFGGDKELSGSVVAVTTLCSILTMPLLVAVAQLIGA